MEFPAGGGILTGWKVRTSKLLRYVSNFDFVVLAFECIFVLFTLYFTVEEIIDVDIIIYFLSLISSMTKFMYTCL
jgi:hypothetical protein